jgi:Beta-propeller domains of methanol dehydrogenase type
MKSAVHEKVGSRQFSVGKSKVKFLPIAFCLLSTLCFATISYAQKTVPELWGQRVHDDAKVLRAETADALELKLKAHEDSTSNQIALLIIESLDGEVIEEYSLKVVEKWKLGTKSKDNGVLLLIAINDHKMRIEVGQGLEGVLTDALCNRIIRNEMAPNFRRDDYDAGVNAAVEAIIKAIAGEYAADEEEGWDPQNTWLIVIAVLIFLIPLVYAFYKEFKSPSATSASDKSDSTTTSSFGSSSSSSSWSSSSSGSSFSGRGGSFGVVDPVGLGKLEI